MNGYVELGYLDLVAAAAFLVLDGLISLRLRLGIERQLAWSAARMVVQLLLVGLVLEAVFAVASPWLTLAIALLMVGFAGREVRARQARRLEGPWGLGLGIGAMLLGGSLVTTVALTSLIEPTPWWTPRYALPLFGMILGNAMTGVSLGLDTLHSRLYRERAAVEARLPLGHDRRSALAPLVRESLRSGFMPIVNAMSVTGIVALPGMMTGQILSGVAPREAVKYQLAIMFLIGGATGLGVVGAVLGSAWRLTDARHRLRLDRLRASAR